MASFVTVTLAPPRQRPSPLAAAGVARPFACRHSGSEAVSARERRPRCSVFSRGAGSLQSRFFGPRDPGFGRRHSSISISRQPCSPSAIQVPIGRGPARELADLVNVALRPAADASAALLGALLPADIRRKLVKAAEHDVTADAPSSQSSWLPGVFRNHSMLATVGTLTLSLLYGSNLPISLSVELQTWILAGFFIAIGLPHAALDHISAYPTFQGWFSDRAWLPAFLVFYLFLTAVTGYFWMVQPFGSLLAYLGLAVLHFGSGDLEHGNTGSINSTFATEILARGLVPISATLKFWPAQVADLFHLVSGLPSSTFVPFISSFANIPSVPVVALAVFGVFLTRTLRRRQGAPELVGDAGASANPALSLFYNACRVVEPATLFLLFQRLPPLLSFTVYWIFWHSVRHVLHVSSALSDRGPLDALGTFYRLAVPFTAAPLVLFAGLYAGLIGRVGSAVALLRMMFVGMSCVLLPHVIVSAWAQRFRPRAAAAAPSAKAAAPLAKAAARP